MYTPKVVALTQLQSAHRKGSLITPKVTTSCYYLAT